MSDLGEVPEGRRGLQSVVETQFRGRGRLVVSLLVLVCSAVLASTIIRFSIYAFYACEPQIYQDLSRPRRGI
jgi:hypothetical protein